MNCLQCREHLTAHVEGLLDPQHEQEVAQHLEICPACRAEAAEHRQLQERLVTNGKVLTAKSFEAAVMNRVVREQAVKQRRIAMTKRYGKLGLGLAAAAAIAAVLFVPWGGSHSSRATAAEVFAEAVEALSNLRSVYITLDMRTLPYDNFVLIGLEYDLVPYEMWSEFGETPKWRVEKPGRVAVMDGEASLLLIRKPAPSLGRGIAVTGGPERTFDTHWLGSLMEVDGVLESELRLARQNGWDLELSHEEGPDDAVTLVVTIEAQAQGDFSNDWLKNKSISGS
ncbi:MAG: anti-sigma factor family protein, partial [Planctomycetota bacterium]